MTILETGSSNDVLLILSFLSLVILFFYLFSYNFIRSILFLCAFSFVHHLSFKFLRILFLIPFNLSIWKYFFIVKNTRLKRNVFGIDFDNPVGLAAGFDKDAKLFDGLILLVWFYRNWYINSKRQLVIQNLDYLD